MAIVRQTWDQFQVKKDMGLFRGVKSLEIKFHWAFWRPLDAVGGKIYFGCYAEHDENDEGFGAPGIPPGMGCSLAVEESDSGVATNGDRSAGCAGGVYVASRVKHAEMWRRLREKYPIISTWIDEAGENETEDLGELWHRIGKEIEACCAFVLHVESSDFPLKGALVEIGIALAMGKPVFVSAQGVDLEERSFRPLGSWVNHSQVRLDQSVSSLDRCMGQATGIAMKSPGAYIPGGVSYSSDSDNFYLDMTHDGMGVAFYKRWKPRCREFPQRQAGLLPSEVMSREKKREVPFSSMFGCSETEQLAKHVVQYLADNGDSWHLPVRVSVFDSLRNAYRLLNHVHSTGSCSPFLEKYTSNGVVTQRFRDIVSRADMSFRDVLSAAEKRFVADQDRLLQEEHSKDPHTLPQEPAWLTRLANAQGTHSISDFVAHEIAKYVRQLREASWPIIRDLECVGDNTDWRDKDQTDRVYSWFEIEPLKAAVLGNKRPVSLGLKPGVYDLGDGEMLAVD